MAKELVTISGLIQKLDEEFSWRRKELSVLRSKIPLAVNPLQGAMLRSVLTLLYAHWEGFVKISMSCYLEHVSRKYLKNSDLNKKFLTLSLQNKVLDYNINSFETRVKIIESLFNEYNKQSNIPKKNIINTKSNLRFDVLKEILFILDLDDSFIDGKKELINDLVDTRNHIAHGEHNVIDYDTFDNIYNDIIALMSYLKTKIENNAATFSYKVATPISI